MKKISEGTVAFDPRFAEKIADVSVVPSTRTAFVESWKRNLLSWAVR